MHRRWIFRGEGEDHLGIDAPLERRNETRERTFLKYGSPKLLVAPCVFSRIRNDERFYPVTVVSAKPA